jgi:hypothetical protein
MPEMPSPVRHEEPVALVRQGPGARAFPRPRYLDTHLWLRRRADHPLLLRTEDFGRLGCAVHFRLERPEDIDDALSSLMREAYELARTGPH